MAVTSTAIPNFYDGSTKLYWVSDLMGLPIDQVNFLAAQFTALGLSYVFRRRLHPSYTSSTVRHFFAVLLGFLLAFFCFGRQTIHLVVICSSCYAILRTISPHISHRLCLGTSMAYLSFIHIQRVLYNYGAYTIDITGPLMIIVQKITSLAFSLNDGLGRKEEDLTISQKRQSLKRVPTLLEYYSYLCNFQGLLAGPLVFYADYIQFINGDNFTKKQSVRNGSVDSNSNSQHLSLQYEPSSAEAVIKKVSISIVFALGVLVFAHRVSAGRLIENSFLLEQSFLQQTLYLVAITSVARWKYYHAWMLADAISNASGLGFNGYDDHGTPKWDLISNVVIEPCELGLSLRDLIDNWNIGTTRWLRAIIYERAPYFKTLLTYLLSALWHGFYPGYYLTFLGGAIFTLASRAVRRSVRPLFQGGKLSRRIYDLMTMLVTRVVLAYITFPFVLLQFWPSLKIYSCQHFWLHFLAFAAVSGLPVVLPPSKSKSHKSSQPNLVSKPT